MKLWFLLLLSFGSFGAKAQIAEAPRLTCEYSSLSVAAFQKGTLRDEAAHVLNNTVKALRVIGMSEDQICKSGIYVRARRLYERVAKEQSEAAVQLKYSSKGSSLEQF